ncbi:MAG: SDR family NAD(P)-dependent oxidoreductase [Clostridia bacterium]|nr:SDR family NAD(P)-dependent oxidoreductase [Eubacteriales bacterium]MDD4461302.1 SDR family NAD(P)-dependent oxidoreductase [Eubacteriales bacterium]NCC47452.1 SDR family NAD(P)-dependent oxidoreductase [Clostridia bacterium]
MHWIEHLTPQQIALELAPRLRGLFWPKLKQVRFEETLTSDVNEKAVWTIDASDYDSPEQLLSALRQQLDHAGGHQPECIRIAPAGCFHLRQRQSGPARLSGRIALVTGAAQGFGEGIARELATAGAVVVIADLNLERARFVAESINESGGEALALPVDVASESSVNTLIETMTLLYGGLDLIISNAGVLRAGGLDELRPEDFEFVTRVNYTGFFLVARAGCRPMKRQAEECPGYSADIIQINSKSGLEGSDRNFAYAGSKFGGIGLVQSFAKELVSWRIKVNAICPGNYYEGPLWSDPDKGLFVQYLKAGKIEGAASIDDVYRAYTAKVPMRRGCRPIDVARAIFYCVEQEYETGQAIPVTGGQVMLN